MAKLVIKTPVVPVAPKMAAPKVAKAPKAPKVEEPKPAANGKQVFEGTIGGQKYLFDAGNGDALLELKAGTGIADQAATIGMTVIPRSQASSYAVNLLFKQWRQAKAAEKKAATPAA